MDMEKVVLNKRYFVPYKDDTGRSIQKILILLDIDANFCYFTNPQKDNKIEILPNSCIGRMEER